MNTWCWCKVLSYWLTALKSLMVVLLCTIWQPAFGFELADYFKRADQRAMELLEQGSPAEAADLFTDDQWRGVSRYRAGKYQEAMEDFSNQKLAGADKARALFNHGTAAARARDYNQAVESLESAVELDPDNKAFKKNLEVAKKLKDLTEKDQNQQESQSDEKSENDEQQEENGEESQEQESDQQESQQQDGSESSDSDQQEGQDGDENGELSNDAAQSQSDSQSEPPLEIDDFKDPAESQEQGEPEEAEGTAAAQSEVSEDDQAARQWLRRIPDDPSQLLRNKIRLNHMIEYPEVNHMQEPW